MMQNQRKIYIKSYGCQMNVYDADYMYQLLAKTGFQTCSEVEEADLVILNTCHIREKATEKIYSEIGRLDKMNKSRQNRDEPFYIIVAGCVAQAEGQEVIARAPIVDAVLGPQSLQKLPEIIQNLDEGKKHIIATEFEVEEKLRLKQKNIQNYKAKISDFLTIQEGCDKFCHFCVVPYTRGKEYSRPVEQILAEARKMVQNGTREIILLGQNVNAYNGTKNDGTKYCLAMLLELLGKKIDNLARLRYTTSHPRDMSLTLCRQHADNEKLMPWLHLPVQSGSDKILKAMNRKHNVEQYLQIIEMIRNAKKNIALSSDFIVGFPGESDEDFLKTIELVKKINFAHSYSFKYSPRPGTPAAKAKNQIPENVKISRLQNLQKLLTEQQKAFNENMKDSVVKVLFEKIGRKNGQISGRTPYMQMVHVEDDEQYIGSEQDVKITKILANSLGGQIIPKNPPVNNTLTQQVHLTY